MKKYMLIQVAEGEILEEIYSSLKKAQEVMKKRDEGSYDWKIVEIPLEEKSISEMTTDEILKQLTYKQKDDIYRALWQKHVENDVQSQAMEAFDISLDEATVEIIANRYVHGDYDCNLSYWVNIENLIQEYLDD